jgi:hypothetical protein
VSTISQSVTLKSMSTSVDRIVDRMRITGLGVVETVVPSPARRGWRCRRRPLA